MLVALKICMSLLTKGLAFTKFSGINYLPLLPVGYIYFKAVVKANINN